MAARHSVRSWPVALSGVVALVVVFAVAPVGWAVLGAAYFAPTVVAVARHHHQVGAIVVIDVLLGWTFVGWVVALAMACSAVKA